MPAFSKLRLVPSKPSETAKTPPAMDDSELLAAIRSGDMSAATAFHDRVRPQIERTIARLLGRDRDHDDIVQNALIELVTTIERFRGDCSLDTWTSTITAHLVYKHVRRRSTERRIFAGTPIEDTFARTKGGTNTGLRDALARVRGHLDAMDEGRAWSFFLHDVCGYDLKEIAQITNVSVAAAQSRLVRGRADIHERVRNDPELIGILDDLEAQ